jgi:alpha-tubulin suppressor-like RCC1 family protein
LQSDGSLWYWGENPNPSFAENVGQTLSPMRVNADTNWVDVGFGVYTVFAIKSDGTLWTWGAERGSIHRRDRSRAGHDSDTHWNQFRLAQHLRNDGMVVQRVD